MQQTAQQSGVTFAVDRVTPASKPLPEHRTHEAIREMLRSDIESCCDYHGTVVTKVHYQPLLAAVYMAFNEHRPLVLSPDAVWLTIAQGVAQHMAVHGERLRSRFVAHEGKLELVFECLGWVDGSPENPWPEAFAGWAEQIRTHVGPKVHDALVCDFTTTGPTERAASQIVLMDVFERYFHYYCYGICGIPTVTLEGTPADWQRLADKAAGLAVFDLDWWLKHLLPICNQFVCASRGQVDAKHWQSICKLREEYGGHIINGWVAKLFPYLRAYINGPCSERNPIFETGEGFQTLVAPPGLSRVPFTWRSQQTGRERNMEAIGGLVGVTQDRQTLALRPKVGWAVRPAPKLDAAIDRVVRNHQTFPGKRFDLEQRVELPPDMAAFYHRTDGADLFAQGQTPACRFVPADAIEPLDWGELPEEINMRGPGGRIWHRFAWLADGSSLAINLDLNNHLAPWWDNKELRRRVDEFRDVFAPVCHVTAHSQGQAGKNPVVALTFTELLECLLESGGQLYWRESQFASPGDAEYFTRRR